MASTTWLFSLVLLTNAFFIQAQYCCGYPGYGAPPYPIIMRNNNDDDGFRDIWPILLLLLFDGFGGGYGGFGGYGGGYGGGCGGGCGGGGGNCGGQNIPIPYPIPIPINNPIVS